MKTKRIKAAALFVLAAALIAALAAVLVTAAPRAYAVDDGLPFTAEHWTAVGGNAEKLNGTAGLSVDKAADAGANKLLLRSKKSYANFRLTYRFQYESAAVGEPWLGNSGVLLHASEDAASGYYLGFYEFGGKLWCSTGYYRDGAFTHMWGVDCGWGEGEGFNEFNVEVLVKDGLVNVLLNGWLFQAAPLPYTEEGGIAIVSDGVTASYGDFAVQPLEADYDLSSKLVRANWSGYNLAGDMFYWNQAGKNHTFRMRLPEAADTATAYYLARRTKVTDGNQSVDVYVDKTASLGLADAWRGGGGTPTVWGNAENKCGHGNSMFGINMVELPLSAFAGVAGGSEVGFLIDKKIEGWYSAAEYWLLYRDADGVLTVADYMDLAYDFDRTAHAFAFDATEGGDKGFHFICQNAGLLTARRRGEQARFVAEPTLEKLADISYTFQPGEGAKAFRAEDYVTLSTNHIGCKLTYSVDGGAPQDTLTLPPLDGEGTVVVSAVPDGSANDLSGAVTFTPPTVTLTYRTERELPAFSVKVVSDGATLAELTLESGSVLDLSQYRPEKAGHRHIGWTDGTDDFPVNAKVTVAENAAYTAKWLTENFTVTVYDGAEAVYSETIAYGGSADFTPPGKPGYDFAGLFEDAELSRPAVLPEQISGAVTLYAKYVPRTYTVTLVYGEGEAETSEAKYGESYAPPSAERAGYEFLGWFTDAALTEKAETLNITGDVTLYAAFRKTGLSGGAIAGIAVGSVAAAGCGAAAFFLIRRKRRAGK